MPDAHTGVVAANGANQNRMPSMVPGFGHESVLRLIESVALVQLAARLKSLVYRGLTSIQARGLQNDYVHCSAETRGNLVRLTFAEESDIYCVVA